jgi:CBS domain-containing protein
MKLQNKNTTNAEKGTKPEESANTNIPKKEVTITENSSNENAPSNTEITTIKNIPSNTKVSTNSDEPSRTEIITSTNTPDYTKVTTITDITTKTELSPRAEIHLSEVMNPNIVFTNAGTSILEVAKIMQLQNVASLAVGNESGVYGVITDRDIALRVVAQGKDPSTTLVGDVMSKQPYFCSTNDSITKAMDEMNKHNVSYLMVKNNEGKIVGFVSSSCSQKYGCLQRYFNDNESFKIISENKI